MYEAVFSPSGGKTLLFFYENVRNGLNFTTLELVNFFLGYRRTYIEIGQKGWVEAISVEKAQKWPKNGP